MAPSQPEDIVLIQRIAQGDRDAFAELYRRYATLVYSMALRIVGDGQTAEEVTQDVFMKIWQKGFMYSEARGRFSSWLLSITRFTAIDRVRYEKRRPAASATPRETPLSQEVANIGTDHALWEQGQHLRALIEQLPPEQKQVVELAYFGGLTHRELAEHLGLPLGTVKSRLRLALNKLRAMWFDEQEQGRA